MCATEVKYWLKQQHVIVPDDWLDACITWIKENDDEFTEATLNALVYEQWLISDLRELQLACLPPNLSDHQKINFSGYFTLQVNSLMDISQSSYSQLQKIRKDDMSNALVSAEPPTQAQWEPRSTRLLMLTMTDGLQNICGMEYRPIPNIDLDMVPGTKVLIHGNLECRMGIILLTSDNIKVLGGEVESLISANSIHNMLLRSLGQEISNPSSAITTTASNENGINSSEVMDQSQSDTIITANDGIYNNRNTDNSNVTVNRGNSCISAVGASAPGNACEDIYNQDAFDAFPDDDLADFEEEIQFLERSAQEIDMDDVTTDNPNTLIGTENIVNSNHTTNFINKNTIEEVTVENRNRSSLFSGNNGAIEEDSLGFKWQNRHNNARKTFPLFSRSMSNSPYLNLQAVKMHTKNSQLSSKSLSSKLSNRNQKNASLSLNIKDSKISVNSYQCEKLQKVNKVNISKVNSSSNNSLNFSSVSSDSSDLQNNSGLFNDSVFIDLTDDEENESCKRLQSTVKSSDQKRNNAAEVTAHFSNQVCHSEIPNDFCSQETFTRPCSSKQLLYSDTKKNVNKELSASVEQDNKPYSKNHQLEAYMNEKTVSSSKTSTKKQTKRLEEKPFVYISHILKHRNEVKTTYTCRAFIVTLLTRLESDSEAGWKLRVKINDGTGSLDALLSNKLLEDLIGFKAELIDLLKSKDNSNPALRKQVKDGLQKFRHVIMNFSGLLELEFSQNEEPLIVGLKELTVKFGNALQNEVCSQLL